MGSIQGKPMKPIAWCALILLCSFPFAFAQRASFSGDAMGAHLNYGRGCAACHTPHSSALANGAGKSSGGSAIAGALWGEYVTGLWSKTIAAGNESPMEDSPRSISEERPDVHGMLNCLSCHDGNYAPSSMMQNRVYEELPPAYGLHNTVPTFGSEGIAPGTLPQPASDGIEREPQLRRSGWMGLLSARRCDHDDRRQIQPVRQRLRVLRQTRQLQRHSRGGLHHVPRSPFDEHVLDWRGIEVRHAPRDLSNHVLSARPLQFRQHHDWRQHQRRSFVANVTPRSRTKPMVAPRRPFSSGTIAEPFPALPDCGGNSTAPPFHPRCASHRDRSACRCWRLGCNKLEFRHLSPQR